MLRAALAEARAAVFLRFAPPLPQAPDIADLLMGRYGDSAGPRQSANALQALLRRLRRAQYDWDKVAPADRLDVAWVLWEGLAPPAEHEAFLRGFLDWLETPRRRLQAARVAAAWAAAFDPALPSVRIAGDWLARHAAWLPEPWPRLAEEFEIFSVEKGPAALAEAFLSVEESAARFFERLRLPARAASGGLVLEMLAAAAVSVERRLAREPRLARRLCDLSLQGTVFRPDAAMGRVPRRAGAIRLALAEALLLPWKRQAPPPEVKARLLAYLLRHYGDARVAREPWTSLPVPAAAIMRRWLTEQTVAAYFRLAGQAKSADRERLSARREFWMSRLGQIDDAWLVGGRQSIAALGPDQPAHGILTGYRPDQAALLLRISGMTVLELSHEASESIWLPGNKLAPPLYRGTDEPYWPAALVGGADFSSAYGKGSWQERLARFIGGAAQNGRREIDAVANEAAY